MGLIVDFQQKKTKLWYYSSNNEIITDKKTHENISDFPTSHEFHAQLTLINLPIMENDLKHRKQRVGRYDLACARTVGTNTAT